MGFVIVAVLPTESLAVIVEKSSPHFHPKIVLGNLINEESHCILRKCLTFLIFQICDLFASVITSLFLILLWFALVSWSIHGDFNSQQVISCSFPGHYWWCLHAPDLLGQDGWNPFDIKLGLMDQLLNLVKAKTCHGHIKYLLISGTVGKMELELSVDVISKLGGECSIICLQVAGRMLSLVNWYDLPRPVNLWKSWIVHQIWLSMR